MEISFTSNRNDDGKDGDLWVCAELVTFDFGWCERFYCDLSNFSSFVLISVS